MMPNMTQIGIAARIAVVIAILGVLSACGSQPHVQESSLLAKPGATVNQFTFVYKNNTLDMSSYGKPSFALGETGFFNFGVHLVDQAKEVFPQYGIQVIQSYLIDVDKPETFPKADEQKFAPYILEVYAVSGNTYENRNAVSVSNVFKATLLEAIPGRSATPIWTTKIDTNTWSGRNAIPKNMEKTLYDEKYAESMLKTLASQMQKDRIIQ